MKTEARFLMPNSYVCFAGGLISGFAFFGLLYFVGVRMFGWNLQLFLGPVSDKEIPFSSLIYVFLYVFFFWGLITVFYKHSLVKYEMSSIKFLEDCFQNSTIISKRLELDNLKASLSQGASVSKIRDTALVQTLLFLIDHCLVTETSERVMEIFARRMDTLQKYTESSYSIIRYVASAIPSLGFIGTVMGISSALGNAGLALDDIKYVTDPLRVAFDTTFIALMESLILMFFVHNMQHREESLLNAIDLFCQEKFIINLRLG